MQKALKMKTFSKYYRLREQEEEGLGDMGSSSDESNLLLKVAKMAISNHKESTLDFFHALARNDEILKEFYASIQTQGTAVHKLLESHLKKRT